MRNEFGPFCCRRYNLALSTFSTLRFAASAESALPSVARFDDGCRRPPATSA